MTERLQLIIAGHIGRGYQPYDVEFEGHRVLGTLACARRAHDRLNEPVVVKEALDRAGAGEALRREIAMLDRLTGRLTDTRYPAQLTRLVGHNPDHAPPFLVATCRGEPLRRWEGELPWDPARTGPVVDDLLRILRYLAMTRIVHGHIGFDTLRWDGKGLQLTDFEHAALAGGTRPRCSCCPPRPAAPARPADDVTAAGLVVYRLYTGETVAGPAEAAERLDLQDTPLRVLLENVFAADPRKVPEARELLRRRRLPDPVTRAGSASPMPEREAEARRNFERLRHEQRAFRQSLSRRPDAPPPSRSLPAVLTWLVLVAALVVVVVVAVL